jgi:four helix bundle protein
MATIQKIEDFEAWVKSRELNLLIHKTVADNVYASLPDLRHQMRKSSRSCMANLAEGFTRKGNKEFLHFISIAKGSLMEVKSDVYASLDQNLISKTRFDEIMALIEMVDKLSNGMSRYLVAKIKRDGTK